MPQSGIVRNVAAPRFPLRFESEELRKAADERAAEKDISLNEWINRTIAYGVTKGGKLKITTRIEAEF